MIFLALVRAEWTKTMRMRSTYLAFAAAAALVLLIQLGFYFKADESPICRGLEAFDLPVSWFINGYTATRITMSVGFFLLMLPMAVMTFARQIAAEDLHGTLRLMLCRPIGRIALLNAKFAVCILYSLLLMGFFFLFSQALGAALFGWGRSVTFNNPREIAFSQISPQFQQLNDADAGGPRPGRHARRFVPEFDYRASAAGRMVQAALRSEIERRLIAPGAAAARIALSWLFTSWVMVSLGAIAFFYSSINRHPIAAMALTLGTLFMFSILQMLASVEENVLVPLFTSIEPYLFTRGLEEWNACFGQTIDWQALGRAALLLGAYSAVFLGLAQLRFWRKDITS